MVSFFVPSFRPTPTSPPLRPNDSNSNSNSNNASSSAMISERALRNNPFGITSRTRTSAALKPAVEDWRREQEELNQALQSLARIFPDIRVEVFRELLVRFDGTSRLHVCVEQLLRHKEEWVAGRWNVPGGTTGSTADEGAAAAAAAADTASTATATASGDDPLVIPPHELFRSPRYKAAVKATLAKEFSALSKSTVEAVLAEVNFCYLRARPTLQDLSRKTWRATLNSFLPLFKRSRDKNEHPLVVWQRPAAADGEAVPRLKETGCEELDRELHEALLAPLLRARREEQERKDLALAETLNEDEAKAAEALYECECCFADVTFEQIATCSDSMHVICYGCIRRTIHEALFGQGWNKSVDVGRVTLKCIAPFGGGGGGGQNHDGCCQGLLSAAVVKQAIQLDRSGAETYAKFEARVASDALRKSQLKLIHCPSCAYAEVDPIHHPSSALVWRFRGEGLISSFIIAVFILDLIPLLLIPLTVMYLLNPAAIRATFRTALLNTTLRTRPKRFTCANPACQRVSCIACQKPWRDPHVCHEPLLLDLRATVEAARTAAVKRTCPRCGLSFVKSTGCNKLTCVCGYSMCYLCRKALTSTWTGGVGGGRERNRRRAPAARRRHNAENNPLHQRNLRAQPHNPDPDSEAEDEVVADDDEEEEEELEGYKHFCQHFRINPGARCTECTKCELYQDEDEEAVARRAGEKAEREWHARHRGTATAAAAGALHVNRDFSVRSSKEGVGKGPKWSWTYLVEEVWREGRWKVDAQAFVDWVVDCVVVVEEA